MMVALLQVVRFPIVATFAGDSSRLLSDALKSKIHLLKVRTKAIIDSDTFNGYVVQSYVIQRWGGGEGNCQDQCSLRIYTYLQSSLLHSITSPRIVVCCLLCVRLHFCLCVGSCVYTCVCVCVHVHACTVYVEQTLAFLDLYQLSLHSPQRRKDVFSLNMLEQPEVWSVVCEQCLKQIKDVTIVTSLTKMASPATLLQSPQLLLQ